MQEAIIRIPTAREYYGWQCGKLEAKVIARVIYQKTKEFIDRNMGNFIQPVRVELVTETHSKNNRSRGSGAIIETINDYIAHNWLHWCKIQVQRYHDLRDCIEETYNLHGMTFTDREKPLVTHESDNCRVVIFKPIDLPDFYVYDEDKGLVEVMCQESEIHSIIPKSSLNDEFRIIYKYQQRTDQWLFVSRLFDSDDEAIFEIKKYYHD